MTGVSRVLPRQRQNNPDERQPHLLLKHHHHHDHDHTQLPLKHHPRSPCHQGHDTVQPCRGQLPLPSRRNIRTLLLSRMRFVGDAASSDTWHDPPACWQVNLRSHAHSAIEYGSRTASGRLDRVYARPIAAARRGKLSLVWGDPWAGWHRRVATSPQPAMLQRVMIRILQRGELESQATMCWGCFLVAGRRRKYRELTLPSS